MFSFPEVIYLRSIYLFITFPQGAVQVLGLVQEILPPISEINSQLGNQVALPSPTALLAASEGETNGTFLNGLWEGATTSQHYAVVESDHPYKPATVANYKVSVLVQCSSAKYL